MRTLLRRLALAAAAFAFVAGCSRAPALVPVTGKVTLNGKPLANTKVSFQPDPDKGTAGPSSVATTDKDGQFTLTCPDAGNKPGAAVGHYRVVLTDLDTYGNVFVGRGNYRHEDDKGAKKEVPKFARFGQQYSDLANTPFKQEVKDGMQPLTFEVKR